MFGIPNQLIGMLLAAIVLVGGGAYAYFERPSSGADAGTAMQGLLHHANAEATSTGDGATLLVTSTAVELHDHLPWTAGVSATVVDEISIDSNVFPSIDGVATAPPFAIFVLPNGRMSAAAWSLGAAAIAQPPCAGTLTLNFPAGAFNGSRVPETYTLDCASGSLQ